jgi:hypothetical protein
MGFFYVLFASRVSNKGPVTVVRAFTHLSGGRQSANYTKPALLGKGIFSNLRTFTTRYDTLQQVCFREWITCFGA